MLAHWILILISNIRFRVQILLKKNVYFLSCIDMTGVDV